MFSLLTMRVLWLTCMLQTAQPDPGEEAKSFAIEIQNEMSRIRLNPYHMFPECSQLEKGMH